MKFPARVEISVLAHPDHFVSVYHDNGLLRPDWMGDRGEPVEISEVKQLLAHFP